MRQQSSKSLMLSQFGVFCHLSQLYRLTATWKLFVMEKYVLEPFFFKTIGGWFPMIILTNGYMLPQISWVRDHRWCSLAKTRKWLKVWFSRLEWFWNSLRGRHHWSHMTSACSGYCNCWVQAIYFNHTCSCYKDEWVCTRLFRTYSN